MSKHQLDQQKLEQDLQEKNKELDALKATILSISEVQQKKELEDKQHQLEEEIQILKYHLNELQKFESNTQIDKIKKETDQLKDSVEVRSDWTYEIIKGSKMYDKLKEIGKTEIEIKEFAENIDKVVRKYLDQELVGFSNSIKNSMCVGIQFAMIETLIKQGVDGSVQFFESFATTKSTSATKAFKGLYTAFGKLGSANEFFILANKVQNIVWYLTDKFSFITSVKYIPELMNPAEFMKLLNNPIWLHQKQISTLDITKILTLNSSTPVDNTAGEDILKAIVNNDKIQDVITEKSIAAIEKSLITADNILNTRGKFKDKTSSLVDKIAGFLNINIPFFGSIGELTGLEFPTDLFDQKKDGGVLNFVLGVLGFRGGIKGIHRSYIKEKLDKLHIDNTFINAVYTNFQKNASSTLTHDSPNSIWKICAFSFSDPTVETTIKSKIPVDYFTLKTSLVEKLDTTSLNPTMIQKFAPNLITSENGKNVVDINKITDKDAFVDQYLKYIIPVLADPSKKFVNSDKVDSTSFTLAVIGGLIGDKYFIEGVSLGLLSVNDFVSIKNSLDEKSSPSSRSVEQQPNFDENQLINKLTEELQKYNSPITAQMVIATSKKFTVPVDYIMAFMKNDSHYGTQGLAKKTHNPGNVGNTDDGSTKDRGTWEAGVDAVGENLKKRIDAYHKTIQSSSYPTVYELATGVSVGGIRFFGVYMSAPTGPDSVTKIQSDLVSLGISNKEQLSLA